MLAEKSATSREYNHVLTFGHLICLVDLNIKNLVLKFENRIYIQKRYDVIFIEICSYVYKRFKKIHVHLFLFKRQPDVESSSMF